MASACCGDTATIPVRNESKAPPAASETTTPSVASGGSRTTMRACAPTSAPAGTRNSTDHQPSGEGGRSPRAPGSSGSPRPTGRTVKAPAGTDWGRSPRGTSRHTTCCGESRVPVSMSAAANGRRSLDGPRKSTRIANSSRAAVPAHRRYGGRRSQNTVSNVGGTEAREKTFGRGSPSPSLPPCGGREPHASRGNGGGLAIGESGRGAMQRALRSVESIRWSRAALRPEDDFRPPAFRPSVHMCAAPRAPPRLVRLPHTLWPLRGAGESTAPQGDGAQASSASIAGISVLTASRSVPSDASNCSSTAWWVTGSCSPSTPTS